MAADTGAGGSEQETRGEQVSEDRRHLAESSWPLAAGRRQRTEEKRRAPSA
jgi:hypothetical protein